MLKIFFLIVFVPFQYLKATPVFVKPQSVSISDYGRGCAIENGTVKCWVRPGGLPSVVPSLTNPRSVATNRENSCALHDGGATCWSAKGVFPSPVVRNPISLAAGEHLICLSDDFGVLCFDGEDWHSYDMGAGSKYLRVSSNEIWALSNGKVEGFVHKDGPMKVPPLNNPREIASALGQTCALDDTGIVCWTLLGQLVSGPNLQGAMAHQLVLANKEYGYFNHGCVLTTKGVECWGKNSYGETSVPSLSNPVKVAVGGENSCAIDDGGLKCWGRNDNKQLNIPPLVKPVDVYINLQGTICAVDQVGLQCWGYDTGWVNEKVENPGLLVSKNGRNCVIQATGVVCWPKHNLSDPRFPSGTSLVNLDLGYDDWCAIESSDVKCYGSLANSIPKLINPIQVTVSDGTLSHFACALDDTGVNCWGNDPYVTQVPALVSPRQVVAGSTWACALDSTEVKCWGRDQFGGTSVPILNNPSQISSGLPLCAIDANGISCWGRDWGANRVPTFSNPRQVCVGINRFGCAVDDLGVQCWGNNTSLQQIPPLINPRSISCGHSHACALDDTGVVCWGDNSSNQCVAPK